MAQVNGRIAMMWAKRIYLHFLNQTNLKRHTTHTHTHPHPLSWFNKLFVVIPQTLSTTCTNQRAFHFTSERKSTAFQSNDNFRWKLLKSIRKQPPHSHRSRRPTQLIGKRFTSQCTSHDVCAHPCGANQLAAIWFTLACSFYPPLSLYIFCRKRTLPGENFARLTSVRSNDTRTTREQRASVSV